MIKPTATFSIRYIIYIYLIIISGFTPDARPFFNRQNGGARHKVLLTATFRHGFSE